MPPERLSALAEARTARVATELTERHGIPANRITRAEPKAGPAEGDPAVRVELGPVEGS